MFGGTDGKSCTANGVCACGQTTTATATITSAEKTPATCTEKGTTTYTATFSGVTWAAEQTKDVVDVPATGEHTYEDGTCTGCGEVAFVPEFGAPSGEGSTTIDKNGTVTSEFKAGTSTDAVITIVSPEGGWKQGGANTFTVSSTNNVACVVIVKNGDTYTRLTATTTGDVHGFTHTFTDDCEIIVAVKGDVNNDGKVTAADAAAASAIEVGNITVDDIEKLIMDVNKDGKVTAADSAAAKAVEVGNLTMPW